jgi:NADH:ubiquinone oxidoreductase subunit 4 (subunit M)
MFNYKIDELIFFFEEYLNVEVYLVSKLNGKHYLLYFVLFEMTKLTYQLVGIWEIRMNLEIKFVFFQGDEVGKAISLRAFAKNE